MDTWLQRLDLPSVIRTMVDRTVALPDTKPDDRTLWSSSMAWDSSIN
jgi:hypothetical protein